MTLVNLPENDDILNLTTLRNKWVAKKSIISSFLYYLVGYQGRIFVQIIKKKTKNYISIRCPKSNPLRTSRERLRKKLGLVVLDQTGPNQRGSGVGLSRRRVA